jgi:hypothetical protein
MPDDQDHRPQTPEPFLEINTSEGGSGGKSSIFFVLTIILVIVFTGFLVFYKYQTDSQAKDKLSAFENLQSEISSKKNSVIENKANQLNSAAKIISTASRSKYLFKALMDEISKKITNDSKLDNLTIDNVGNVTMDGKSGSYRSVADLAVALKSSKKLSDIQISGLSMSSDSGKNTVTFSISAKIKDWKGASDTVAEIETNEVQGGVGE